MYKAMLVSMYMSPKQPLKVHSMLYQTFFPYVSTAYILINLIKTLFPCMVINVLILMTSSTILVLILWKEMFCFSISNWKITDIPNGFSIFYFLTPGNSIHYQWSVPFDEQCVYSMTYSTKFVSRRSQSQITALGNLISEWYLYLTLCSFELCFFSVWH